MKKVEITLRKITQQDLVEYEHWKLPIHRYHELNGPYFKKASNEEISTEVQEILMEFQKGNTDPLPNKMLISNKSLAVLGEVSWYWKSEETCWLEVGVVIFDEVNWGKGIGTQALELWINQVFEMKKDIVRIGLSTWSGNRGMITLAERLGMIKEAEYRKARIVDGEYYDSVSYGILRKEWEGNVIIPILFQGFKILKKGN